MDLNKLPLDDLLKFQSKISLMGTNKMKDDFNIIEKIFMCFYLNQKEEAYQKMKKTEKKKLLNLIYDCICRKIEIGKRVFGSFGFPLDLRKQSKKNLIRLSEALKKDNSIQIMHLMVDGISMQILTETIQTKYSLKKLVIREIYDDVGALSLSKALESNNTMEKLIFEFSKLNESSAKFLFKFLKKNNSLRSINFSRIEFEEEAYNQLIQNLNKNKSLKKINFEGFNFNFKKVFYIKNPKLETIKFLWDKNKEEKGVEYLLKSLKKISALKKFSLINYSLNNEEKKSLCSFLRNKISLKTLVFIMNDFGVDGMKFLCETLIQNNSVESIKFSELKCEEVKIFSQHLNQISSLTNLGFPFSEIEEEDIKFISERIKQNDSLKKIDFSFNDKIKDNGIKYLSEALIQNCSLKELILEDVKMGNQGIKYLCQSLEHNRSLQRIDLSENEIGDKGMKYLCQILVHNNSLKDLNLSNNHFTDKSINYFRSLNLERLDVSYNNLKKKGLKLLFKNLKSNHSLKCISFHIPKLDSKKNFFLLVDLLKTNDTITELNYTPGRAIRSYVTPLVKYLLNCNVEWKPNHHLSFSKCFLDCVFLFVCCLKRIEKKLPFKFGKFVLFEIIKKIERKSFLHLDFPGEQSIDEEESKTENRKRKREEDDDDEEEEEEEDDDDQDEEEEDFSSEN